MNDLYRFHDRLFFTMGDIAAVYSVGGTFVEFVTIEHIKYRSKL